MDLIDCIWPDDLSQVQWGALSAWVSSLLTAVSIFLALYIILRDHKYKERGQAALVSCYGIVHSGIVPASQLLHEEDQLSPKERRRQYTIHVENCSTLPIFRVGVRTRMLSRREYQRREPQSVSLPRTKATLPRWRPKRLEVINFSRTGAVQQLRPEETLETTVSLPDFPLRMMVGVHFGDGHGRYWLKDVRSGKLEKSSRRGWK